MLSGELGDKLEAFEFDGTKAVKKTVDVSGYKYILVTSFATGGSYTAVVLKKCN